MTNSTRELPSGYQLISQQKLYKPEENDIIYLKWWKGRIDNQEYSIQQHLIQIWCQNQVVQTNKS